MAAEHAGKKVRCPNCGNLTEIPAQSTTQMPPSVATPDPFASPFPQPGAMPGKPAPPQAAGQPPQSHFHTAAQPPYHGGQYSPPSDTDGLGIAGIVIGSISILFALACPCVAPVLIIAGCICAFTCNGHLRTPAIIVNCVAIGLFVIRMIITVVFMAGAMTLQ
ncbi:MAG: DUF3824 domain-containing protein [Planctomycetota bacterium]